MTESEIKSGNELIANFMKQGVWKVKRKDKDRPYWSNDYTTKGEAIEGIVTFTNPPITETLEPYFVAPEYHKSWDLLMPVWYKIREIGYAEANLEIGMYSLREHIKKALCNGTIELAFAEIIAFIKWYNSVKTK